MIEDTLQELSQALAEVYQGVKKYKTEGADTIPLIHKMLIFRELYHRYDKESDALFTLGGEDA